MPMLVNNNDNANPIANSIVNSQLQLTPMLAADLRLILAYNAQLLVDQIFAQQLRSAQTAKGSSQLLLAQQQPPNENLAKPGPEHGGWVHDGLPKSKSAAEEIPDPPASFPASPASSSSSSADGSVQCQSPASSSSAWHCQWLHCSRRLPSQQLLLDHLRTDHLMLVHVGQADVVCQWRGCQRRQKPFGAIYMLQQHLRAHTGEKPYQCHWQNCAKRYSRLENLKTHLRKHTGERPYTCPVCSAGFTNASDRAKHVDRVHGHQKRYHCPQPGCPSAYTDPSSLRKHIYSQHGKQEWTSYKQAKQLTGNNKSGLIR